MTESEDSMTDESEESQGPASIDAKRDATLVPRLFQLADRKELPAELHEQAAHMTQVQELKTGLEREYALKFHVRAAHLRASARESAQPCAYDTIQAACSNVAKIARSGLCEVYDLKRARANRDSQDLKGAMLRCGLRKQRYEIFFRTLLLLYSILLYHSLEFFVNISVLGQWVWNGQTVCGRLCPGTTWGFFSKFSRGSNSRTRLRERPWKSRFTWPCVMTKLTSSESCLATVVGQPDTMCVRFQCPIQSFGHQQGCYPCVASRTLGRGPRRVERLVAG
jgi:hypothetical protein